MNLESQIRLASPSDINLLTEIAIAAKRSNGYSDAFMDACRDELTITAQELAMGEYWVVEADVIQGFVGLIDVPGQDIAEIHSFFIGPAWQRQGIGKRLWQKILQRTHEKGMQAIILDADPAAVPFYKSLGFEVIGKVPSGSIAGRTIPRMKLQIV